jgi:hypothetical protein
MKLHKLAASQIREQARTPKMLVGSWITAAEQFVSIPAEFSCTPSPGARNKSLEVVHKNKPPMGGNAQWAWYSL